MTVSDSDVFNSFRQFQRSFKEARMHSPLLTDLFQWNKPTWQQQQCKTELSESSLFSAINGGTIQALVNIQAFREGQKRATVEETGVVALKHKPK